MNFRKLFFRCSIVIFFSLLIFLELNLLANQNTPISKSNILIYFYPTLNILSWKAQSMACSDQCWFSKQSSLHYQTSTHNCMMRNSWWHNFINSSSFRTPPLNFLCFCMIPHGTYDKQHVGILLCFFFDTWIQNGKSFSIELHCSVWTW